MKIREITLVKNDRLTSNYHNNNHTAWFCKVCDKIGFMKANWKHLKKYHCGRRMKAFFGTDKELKKQVLEYRDKIGLPTLET